MFNLGKVVTTDDADAATAAYNNTTAISNCRINSQRVHNKFRLEKVDSEPELQMHFISSSTAVAGEICTCSGHKFRFKIFARSTSKPQFVISCALPRTALSLMHAIRVLIYGSGSHLKLILTKKYRRLFILKVKHISGLPCLNFPKLDS